MWVDAHLHLDAAAFDADREIVLARAAAAGVGLLVSAGTSVEGSRRVLGLVQRYPHLRAAVGIHPEEAGAFTPSHLEALAELTRHPRVVAVGEVGLDYLRADVPRHLQIEVFRAQVRLARDRGLPLVVHNREAYEDIEEILKEEGATRVILHCFTGPPEVATRWAAAGWMISLAGPLTFANAGALREAARGVPADRLLVETDAPYLAPVPFRGRRCEPAYLVHTARALAALRGINTGTLEAVLEENARQAFGLRDDMPSHVRVT